MPLKENIKNFGFTAVISSITMHSYYLAIKADQQTKTAEKVLLEKVSSIKQEINQKETKEGLAITQGNKEEQKVINKQYAEIDDIETTKNLEDKSNSLSAKFYDNNKNILEKVNNSDILSIISNLIDNYYSWLATLGPEKILAVFNIIIDSVLFVNLFSVFSLLMGEHLIQFFKLELKYPKLANLIRIKNKVTKYYKTMYLLIYIFFLIFALLGNLFALFAEYFV